MDATVKFLQVNGSFVYDERYVWCYFPDSPHLFFAACNPQGLLVSDVHIGKVRKTDGGLVLIESRLDRALLDSRSDDFFLELKLRLDNKDSPVL